MDEDEARRELARELERPMFQQDQSKVQWLNTRIAIIEWLKSIEERKSVRNFERELRDLGVID